VEWVQTTGKTIDEAKERALDELGVDDRDAEFEVLEEPRSGLFGLSRGDAKVRARVRPTTPRPKQERGRRRQGGGSGGGSGRNRGGRGRGSGGGGNGGSGGDRGDRGGNRGGGDRNRNRSGEGQRSRSGGGERGEKGEKQQDRDQDAPREQRSGSGGRGGGRDRNRPARERPRSEDDDRSVKDEGEAMSEASVQEQAEAAEAFLSGLVEAFGLSATVSSEEVDEAVEVRIDGDDLGLLIGPKGRTLWALQELTKTVVQRQQGGGLSTRIRVDVAGYRERRKAALERFTQDAAAAVLESGQARALEPMGAADRKVVHDTVNDIDGVVTRSEGEDPRRRVVIAPE
jgi:spoIIIJ-associated protein